MIVNDTTVPLTFVSPRQINFQWPVETPGSSAKLQVVSGQRKSAVVNVPVAAARPGLSQSGQLAIAQDPVTGSLVGTPSNPAKAGSVIVLYATGLGLTTCNVALGQPSPYVLCPTGTSPFVNFGGHDAQVQFAGLTPGFVGLYQVNVQVPSEAVGLVTVTLASSGQNDSTAKVQVAQ